MTLTEIFASIGFGVVVGLVFALIIELKNGKK